MVKGKQCLVDPENFVILLSDEILDDNIELAAGAQGKSVFRIFSVVCLTPLYMMIAYPLWKNKTTAALMQRCFFFTKTSAAQAGQVNQYSNFEKHIDIYLCVCYNKRIDNYQCEVRGMKSTDIALICKALGDSNRLEIVRMLSDGEKCGCKLLERFEITQPTLSHHMKILVECGLVNARKEGKWQHYSLNCKTLAGFKSFIDGLSCCESGSDCESGCCP